MECKTQRREKKNRRKKKILSKHWSTVHWIKNYALHAIFTYRAWTSWIFLCMVKAWENTAQTKKKKITHAFRSLLYKLKMIFTYFNGECLSNPAARQLNHTPINIQNNISNRRTRFVCIYIFTIANVWSLANHVRILLWIRFLT